MPIDIDLFDSDKSHLYKVDLNLLTVFAAVMRERSYTGAGRVLGISQPAVSNAISRLKVLLNDELFIRRGRGVDPTEHANEIYIPVQLGLHLVQKILPDINAELFDS